MAGGPVGLLGLRIARFELLSDWYKVESPRRSLPATWEYPEQASTGGHEPVPASRLPFSTTKVGHIAPHWHPAPLGEWER
ncbi:hypothetical protein SRABI83_02305 [Arthrobacter sp. Bi83]|nr:hypothetical protein SRABI83_02305 [Arthrobacter sp. Bi83]